MTAELRSLILADRLVPGSLATVKTDGDKTASAVRQACATLNITGKVHREGPNGASLCPDVAAIQRYGGVRLTYDISGNAQRNCAMFAIRTVLAIVEPSLRLFVKGSEIVVRS